MPVFQCHAETTGSAPADSTLYRFTPVYDSVIASYKRLAMQSSKARLFPYGKTDIGLPLQLFVISANGIFDPSRLHELGKCILMINNGIHPGEPDGINASILFAKELLARVDDNKDLKNVVVCIIPTLNIDGALNRGCCSRANQNGPPEYGFRGNAKNLDLNRDFMKCDASNTRSFIKMFRQWNPDVLLDTHVSDGADYSYTMTLISTQPDKLYPITGNYSKNILTPSLYKQMDRRKDAMCPYVNTEPWENPPDSGIIGFLDTPRFLTGYTSLFSTFSYISESHMLKPFANRVASTLNLMRSLLEECSLQHSDILEVRKASIQDNSNRKEYPVNFTLNTKVHDKLSFSGYTASFRKSDITGLPRLYYDHSKPYTKEIPFYNLYEPEKIIHAPLYYLIPQAWVTVFEKLSDNNVRMILVREDSVITAEVTYIDSFSTPAKPYEGHYVHSSVKIHRDTEQVLMRKGDYLVPVFQDANRLVVEALEPECTDSYFNWGFFDSILQEKEWFSPYVFEDLASKILAENPELHKRFQAKKTEDKEFASDSFAQLYFIYRNSPYFEPTLNRYPVSRVLIQGK